MVYRARKALRPGRSLEGKPLPARKRVAVILGLRILAGQAKPFAGPRSTYVEASIDERGFVPPPSRQPFGADLLGHFTQWQS